MYNYICNRTQTALFWKQRKKSSLKYSNFILEGCRGLITPTIHLLYNFLEVLLEAADGLLFDLKYDHSLAKNMKKLKKNTKKKSPPIKIDERTVKC